MAMPMNNEVVGIAKDEPTLNNAVDDLWQAGFAIHEVSVQGDPEQLRMAIGKAYIDPKLLADNPHTPRKDPTMPEEFGWLLAFCIMIPLFMGTLLGSIIASGIRGADFAIIQGLVGGAIVGALIGVALSLLIKLRHDQRIAAQTQQGGFVIWVTADSEDKKTKAKMILQRDGAYDVHEHLKMAQLTEDQWNQ